MHLGIHKQSYRKRNEKDKLQESFKDRFVAIMFLGRQIIFLYIEISGAADLSSKFDTNK